MKLLLVGCGKMGGALLKGWLDKSIAPPENFFVISPDTKATDYPGVHLMTLDAAKSKSFDVVLFAVKPQLAEDILPLYKSFVSEQTIFISIMAGLSVASLKKHLGQEAKIVRTMPNLPASIHQGISVLYTEDDISNEQAHHAYDLMRAVGEAIWIDDEEKLHLVTALSGSGPAYFYAFVEALMNKAIELGLEPTLAEKLAENTFIGSAELLARSTKKSTDLRIEVTSPGGTTEAALKTLFEDRALSNLMKKALSAAAKRSQELS